VVVFLVVFLILIAAVLLLVVLVGSRTAILRFRALAARILRVSGSAARAFAARGL
jgi:signal transduction histidine kinase